MPLDMKIYGIDGPSVIACIEPILPSPQGNLPRQHSRYNMVSDQDLYIGEDDRPTEVEGLVRIMIAALKLRLIHPYNLAIDKLHTVVMTQKTPGQASTAFLDFVSRTPRVLTDWWEAPQPYTVTFDIESDHLLIDILAAVGPKALEVLVEPGYGIPNELIQAARNCIFEDATNPINRMMSTSSASYTISTLERGLVPSRLQDIIRSQTWLEGKHSDTVGSTSKSFSFDLRESDESVASAAFLRE